MCALNMVKVQCVTVKLLIIMSNMVKLLKHFHNKNHKHMPKQLLSK